MRRGLGIGLLVGMVLVMPAVALARSGGTASGLLVRVEGDVVVDADESADLVIVVSGDAYVYGRAAVVVVIGGTARLADARVGRLVVVRGAAALEGTSRVTGDVWLLSARLEQGSQAAVDGSVRGILGIALWRFVVEEPLLAIGLLALVVGAGAVGLAVGARTMQRAGAALTDYPVESLGAALLFFLVAPAVALLLFFSVVGLPVSVIYLVVCLPALALAGFCICALRLGRWVLRSRSARPYGAAALGSVVLAAAGLIPWVGQLILLAACALGAGALIVVVRRGRVQTDSTPTVGEG